MKQKIKLLTNKAMAPKLYFIYKILRCIDKTITVKKIEKIDSKSKYKNYKDS